MVSVELHGLVKRFAGHMAIDHIDLHIPSGAFVTLLGPSGCGKTTTLRCIAGLEEPDGGRVLVGDRTFVDVERRIFVPPEKRNVGMVFQSYALWPHMSVSQNVAYPLRRQRWSRQDIDQEVTRLLEMVNLSAQRQRSVGALSGGQQQRVALARAMVGKPVLTLFDEPLSNLDVKLRDRMRTEIRRLHDRIGMTSIYVTHDQGEAFALSDIIVVMNEGRIQQIGSPQDIYFRPNNDFVADFVGFENRFPATAHAGVDDHIRVIFGNGAEAEVRMSGVSDGDSVVVFARTTAVRFTEIPGFLQVAAGKVIHIAYAGDSFELHVATDAGVFRGREPINGQERPPFAVGDSVPVYLEREAAVFLASPPTPHDRPPPVVTSA